MSHSMTRTRLAMLAGADSAVLVGVAHAGITDPGLTFTATNAQGSGTISVPLSSGVSLPGGGWQWVLTGPPLNIMSPTNEVIGSISQGSITMTDTGGIVASTFAATAGGLATSFQINSALVSFGAMGNPEARASAGITVTDNNGDGATITGNRPGGTAYSAHYNGQTPGGTPFANLIAGPIIEPSAFGSEASSQSFPAAPGAFSTIVGSVSSMSTVWDFTVTPGDQASGTSVFVILPAPASLAVLGLGGLATARRRRS